MGVSEWVQDPVDAVSHDIKMEEKSDSRDGQQRSPQGLDTAVVVDDADLAGLVGCSGDVEEDGHQRASCTEDAG